MVTVTNEVVTCHAAPVQIEGELSDGRMYYFRSRFQHAELAIGDTIDLAVQHSVMDDGPHTRVKITENTFDAGFISIEEARQLRDELLATILEAEG